MPSALVGMGSNISPEQHLADAAAEIKKRFSDVKFSGVYQSKAVGMDGDDFLNACCLIGNVPDREELIGWFKSLEDEHGRDRSEGSWKPRTLDLDLLMFDGKVLDDDLYRYPHVYVPASELVDVELPALENSVVLKIELSL
ncbi:MAG: 2-amino-4-hydroxy-6-hydroxymethyldihydropteridine diphosphokinase [Mariprofundaceae bacterium]